MDLINGITFFTTEPEAGPEVFQAVIREGIAGPEALFEEYDRHFNFPYFGFNWHALDECLKDLQWISQPQVIITHRRLPELSENDLRRYLDALCAAIEAWRNIKEVELWPDVLNFYPEVIEHGLEVRFNRADEKQIKSAASEAEFVRYLAGESGWVKYFVL